MNALSDGGESVVIALVQQRLGAIEAKLDKVVDDHEARLRRLEAWSYGIPVAALISLGSVIAAIVAASR
jgi:hypothetical protein